jgi:hypothetical protein
MRRAGRLLLEFLVPLYGIASTPERRRYWRSLPFEPLHRGNAADRAEDVQADPLGDQTVLARLVPSTSKPVNCWIGWNMHLITGMLPDADRNAEDTADLSLSQKRTGIVPGRQSRRASEKYQEGSERQANTCFHGMSLFSRPEICGQCTGRVNSVKWSYLSGTPVQKVDTGQSAG